MSGRYTALGLVLVGPVIVNILFFHTFLDPSGLPTAMVLAVIHCRWAATAPDPMAFP